jgi:metallo-beta-lactamase class B
MAFKSEAGSKDPVEVLAFTPWEMAVEAFQVTPNTYYVSGQTWVGAYLIDTGDGLILIDTAIPESLYLLVDSIYKLGYKLTDIKKILISHAHFDHMGAAAALKKMTGAPIYMSREDEEFMKVSPNETMLLDCNSHAQYFEVDCFYDDNQSICLGDIEIRTKLTPGHTIGTTSFFWEEKNPIINATYQIAMHGGVGAFSMAEEYYKTSKMLTPKLRDKFLEDIEEMKKYHVDIALPSHPNQIIIMDCAGSYTHESQPYLDETVWADFLEERRNQVLALVK